MGNDTEILNITSNNNFTIPDFCTISQCNQVIYITEVVCMAGFTSLADIFMVELCNFPSVRTDELYVIKSIIYKSELEKTQNLL